MYSSDFGSKQQEAQQTQQEAQEALTESRFNCAIPIRMSNVYDDKLFVEYMMDSYAKVNKLAFLGEARSKDFNPDYIVSPKSYAEVGNNYNANPACIY